MIRLHITTEGQTEEKFVNLCLKDHLAAFQVFCDARCVLTSKDTRLHRSYRVCSWLQCLESLNE